MKLYARITPKNYTQELLLLPNNLAVSSFLEFMSWKVGCLNIHVLILKPMFLRNYLCFMLQYVHHLQKKYSLSSFNLLGHTAPVQAGSLLILGPFIDYWLTSKRIDVYNYTLPAMVRI